MPLKLHRRANFEPKSRKFAEKLLKDVLWQTCCDPEMNFGVNVASFCVLTDIPTQTSGDMNSRSINCPEGRAAAWSNCFAALNDANWLNGN